MGTGARLYSPEQTISPSILGETFSLSRVTQTLTEAQTVESNYNIGANIDK